MNCSDSVTGTSVGMRIVSNLSRFLVLLAALLLGSFNLRANPDHGFFQIVLGDIASFASDEENLALEINFSSESGFILDIYSHDTGWSHTGQHSCSDELSLGWEFRRPMDNNGDYLLGISYWNWEDCDSFVTDSGFKWHAGFRLASTSNFQLDLKYSGFLATDYSHDNRLDLDVAIGGKSKIVFGWDFEKDFLLLGFRTG